MAERLNLMVQARDILATPSHEGLEITVNQFFMPKDTDEFRTAHALYDLCIEKFPNCLSLMLLKVYRCSSSEVARFRSIYLLNEAFTALLRTRSLELHHIALHYIKPLVVSCLKMPKAKDSEAKILQTIVSVVASTVNMLDNGGWDELSDCILAVANSEPLRAFHVFLGLPQVKLEFLDPFLEKLLTEAQVILSNTEHEIAEDWTLALTSVVKIGIQVLNWEMRSHLIANIRSMILNSASVLVEKRMENFLRLRLLQLDKFLAQDSKLSEHNNDQSSFVSEVVTLIRKLCFKVMLPSFLQSEESQGRRVLFDNDWYQYLKTLTPLDILKMVASTPLGELALEIAVRQLNVLLSAHTSKTAEIDISVIRQLQPLLVACLEKEEIPDNTFKILGEVVHHVAKEVLINQKETWMDLCHYISSHCQTNFTRGCNIFTCLAVPLDEQGFVIPVMDKFLPEIKTRLNPPRELLVDGSCWVLAFTGAFCAIIQMIDFVEDIEDKMLNSVEELVKSRMGGRLVRTAFIDMQSIVEKQVGWYGSNEFTLVRRLLGRLETIQGMGIESKVVLEDINGIVERRAT